MVYGYRTGTDINHNPARIVLRVTANAGQKDVVTSGNPARGARKFHGIIAGDKFFTIKLMIIKLLEHEGTEL